MPITAGDAWQQMARAGSWAITPQSHTGSKGSEAETLKTRPQWHTSASEAAYCKGSITSQNTTTNWGPTVHLWTDAGHFSVNRGRRLNQPKQKNKTTSEMRLPMERKKSHKGASWTKMCLSYFTQSSLELCIFLNHKTRTIVITEFSMCPCC